MPSSYYKIIKCPFISIIFDHFIVLPFQEDGRTIFKIEVTKV
jgi:hypothetical protein